jgi:nondiscriminating glutamyl-tRNA synthetase
MVRLRFAPSPTGHLHIGGARTALFNFLYAKKFGGDFILRIENTDQARNVESATEKFLEGFKWLGLDWDEGPDVGGAYGPYIQMDRLSIYQNYIERLVREGKAYYCYCTKEEEDLERERLKALGKVYHYSGKCRYLDEKTQKQYEKEGRSYTIRFRVPDDQDVLFTDLVRGDMKFNTNDIGDFIIVKSNGVPVYNFAVTVDDALMQITHVIRGEEHLSNTPCQILLYEALGWKTPEFGHLPLILNPNGKKLSKRDESIIQFIEQYKDLGYLPEALVNYLALLGWSPSGELSEEEIFSLDELIQHFSIDRVSKAGAIFDVEKLAWINGQYIKKADLDRIVDMAIPYLQKEGYIGENFDREWLTHLVSLFQSGMSAVSEITQLAKQFFVDDVSYDEEANQILAGESVSVVLSAFQAKVNTLEEYTPDNIKALLKEVQKETGYKGKQLFMPVRVAATGQNHGPDLNKTLYLLGKEKVLERINQIIS